MSTRLVAGFTSRRILVGYVLGAAFLIVLYSSANRPIWYDEMVTFTIGGLPNIGEVLREVSVTTTNLNQGTTGSYLVAEYVSLSVFGAHWWSMRLPSLLASIWALAAIFVFLRSKRVSGVLIVATPFLALAYPTLWYFAGEARTYMPLVAGVLGVLAYYSLPDNRRQSLSGRILGWGSVAVGVLFHPYFLLYWPAIAVFAAWSAAWSSKKKWTLKQTLRHANPPLVILGFSAGIVLGAGTWLRGNIDQPVPWDEWLGAPLWKELATALLWPFVEAGWLGLIAGLILLGLIAVTLNSRPPRVVSPTPTIVLVFIAFTLALIVTFGSIIAEFWVFPRQWITSQTRVLVAIPWATSSAIAS